MKTTVEIPDSLLEQVRRQAASEGSTVRALVEEGLRRVLEERQRKAGSFQLRKVTFRGEGLHPDLADGSWDTVRGLIYDGHGA
ncbi:MAG: hypothetical protein AMXMBFR33_24160 [Candidatus Xenobia bacterium]